MSATYAITAVYKFHPLSDEEVKTKREILFSFGEENDMCGLVLIAPEGFNGTVAASKEVLEKFKDLLIEQFGELTLKDSASSEKPFKRWFVKIREEIVGLGNTDIVPEDMDDESHLTPKEWNRVIEEEDIVLLDTRNDYETEIGIFEGAIDPNLKQFNEFPEWVKKCDIPKDKKVLMYCTGGIRCEKAQQEMKRQGFSHVYQLKGGILQYIKEYPNKYWKGECFVFDHRTAVNQDLDPSTKYSLCPHTGDPADIQISCVRCGEEARINPKCSGLQKETCSKNCCEQWRRVLEKSKVQ